MQQHRKVLSNSDQYSWEIYILYVYMGYKFAYMANGECNAYMVSLLQNKRLNWNPTTYILLWMKYFNENIYLHKSVYETL